MQRFNRTFPSTLEGKKLAQNRKRAFRQDSEWRSKHEDFDKAAELYEAKSGDKDENGIPRMNYVRRAVEDYVAVAIKNTPKAKLQADRYVDSADSKKEREIRLEVIRESERTINAYVRSILRDNDWTDMRRRALKQAGIYGVGYLKVDVDRSADARYSYALRDLFDKPYDDWTPSDVERYKSLSARFSVEHIDSRDVFWQTGVRSVGDKMYRVSTIERFSTKTLRERYQNEEISHGKPPYNVEEDPDGNSGITAVLTTWELEPVVNEVVMPGEKEGEVVTKEAMTDWQMVKTVIAGGELVEKEVWSSSEGSIQLPIIPFYLRESEDHPYGYSIPLMLEGHQSWLNYMSTAVMKQAKNATSSQGMAIFQQNLGPGDEKKIDRVLEEGGVAKIKGNDLSGMTDIRELVMPLNYNGSQINPAMIQALRMGKENLQNQSQTVDQSAVSSARTGSAKRTEINMGDRPKTLSLELISTGVCDVHDQLFELIRTNKKTEEMVRVHRSGEGESNAKLNKPYRREIPVFDRAGNVVMDGGEPKTRMLEMKVNDTSLEMKAQTEGEGNLPMDMMSKFQFLTMLAEQKNPDTGRGIIGHETIRELTLDENIKALDDRMREENSNWQRELQAIFREHPEAVEQLQMLDEQAQGGSAQGGTSQGGSSMGGRVAPDRQAETRERRSEMAPQASNPMGGPTA